MKLLYDVVGEKWYNENGEGFFTGNPNVAYGNSERIEIQLYSEVVGANTSSNAVDSWKKFTEFSGDGYGAVLSTDDNFVHWYKASLLQNVPAGAVTVIDVATSQGIEQIAESGNLCLYSNASAGEAVEYVSRCAIEGGIRFTAEAGSALENSYSAGTQVDMPEMLYAEATMLPEASDPATGLFVFDLVMDSPKLRNAMQYKSVEELDTAGLELMVFRTLPGGVVRIVKRCINRYFCIKGGIADLQTGVPVPNTQENRIAVILDSVISAGLEVQASTNGTTWSNYDSVTEFQALRWIRLRISGSGAAWSVAIPLIVGAQGTAGTSIATYVAYASNSDGANWSLTPAGTLKYRAEIHCVPLGRNPVASDFAGAVWMKYLGDDFAAGDIPSDVAQLTDTSGKLITAAERSKLASLLTGYRGFFATAAALKTAHSTGADGDFATVGATDTIWSWDSDTADWVDTQSVSITPAWDNIEGKPTAFPAAAHTHLPAEAGAAPADHDHNSSYAAKSSEHSHANASSLDKIGETADGAMTFNGNPIGGAVPDSWTTLTAAATMTLSPENGTRQKVTVTDDAVITEPTLSLAAAELLLDIEVPTGKTATIASSLILTGPGRWHVGWIFNGGYALRYPAVKVV